MSVHMFNATGASSQRRATAALDMSAVILVGYGDNLYPFNQGTNIISKALLPVGNQTIIDRVLDWVLASGLADVLILVPSHDYTAISDHLSGHYSPASQPRARITLKKHNEGERDDDSESSEAGGRDGTARLLRRFKSFIKTDFVLLPCDLAPPPDLTLVKILERHWSRPEAVLTSVLYEPVPSVKEEEDRLLVALDKETDEVLMIQPLESLEEDLELRMSLLSAHPSLSLTTRLLDAHIYVCRRTILDLMTTRRTKDLDSMKEQVIPWLIKGGWQRGLNEQWSSILVPRRKDIFEAALARSTTCRDPSSLDFGYPTPDSSPSSGGRTPLPQTDPFVATTQRAKRKHERWTCQAIVHSPVLPAETVVSKGAKGKQPVFIEPGHLIRANTLPGYWELNRQLVRSLAANNPNSQKVAPGEDSSIQSSAQISSDSLIGEGTSIGERASIKKCVVGRHCHIGKNVKLTGSVLWDFVTIEDNARVENAILCSNVRIGEKATVKDCEFGPGFEATMSANLKGERLIAGQDV